MEDGETNEGDTGGRETTNTSETNKKPLSVIQEARQIRDEIKEERKKITEENNRREEIVAKEMLGGQSDAGQTPEKPSKEEEKTKQAKEYFKGTALGDAISKTNES